MILLVQILAPRADRDAAFVRFLARSSEAVQRVADHRLREPDRQRDDAVLSRFGPALQEPRPELLSSLGFGLACVAESARAVFPSEFRAPQTVAHSDVSVSFRKSLLRAFVTPFVDGLRSVDADGQRDQNGSTQICRGLKGNWPRQP